MFKKAVEAIRNGHSPYLFTAIDGEQIGKTALLDGKDFYGELSLISNTDMDGELPVVRNNVLIERITTPPHLILCGGGHVSVAVARIAKMIGFHITVIDERAEFANTERP